MDTKSLAKSKRAHTLHHKKHHPNQKAKSTTIPVGSTSTENTLGKTVTEKPRKIAGPSKLPSNWDRYEDEDDFVTESQTDGQPDQSSQPSDVLVPKSKGADYAYLIAEAKSQNSTKSLEIFPSLDDFVSDFGQGKDSLFGIQGESLLSSIQNDSFFVDDKTPANCEASFLSLNLHALSEQLAKIDLPKRLFMEADLFPSDLYSEKEDESRNNNKDQNNANRKELEAYNHDELASYTIDSDPNTKSVSKPNENKSKFEAEKSELELDLLLDSFSEANLKEKASTSKKTTLSFDIDETLDDLLNEKYTPVHKTDPTRGPASQPVSKSEILDDFDSWLDTI